MTPFKVVQQGGLFRLRKLDGTAFPPASSGAEYCVERLCDLPDLIEKARRDGVVA
jgi:hypothetical protein